jgi:hypothetical protein
MLALSTKLFKDRAEPLQKDIEEVGIPILKKWMHSNYRCRGASTMDSAKESYLSVILT